MARPPGSSSARRSPWKADVGKAWWLLCQDSPNEIQDSHQTFRDSSCDANRRRPEKWQIELIENVTCWSRKILTAPPQISPARNPYRAAEERPAGERRQEQRDENQREEEL